MNDLTRAECQKLKEWGMSRAHRIDGWYYDEYGTLWLGKEIHLSSIGGDEYVKIPSPQELIEFAKTKAALTIKEMDNDWQIFIIYDNNNASYRAILMDGWEAVLEGYHERDLSRALYALIEKLVETKNA